MKSFVACSLLLMLALCSCTKKKTLFRLLSSGRTGVHFENHMTENDSINPIDLTNIYNGGGVGIGDFNNDGLQDIYFTANMVSNRLYLNKGNFTFEDITQKAGVGGEGKWCRGVAVVDINNDALPDLYICAAMSNNVVKRQNILYVNQGNDKDGVPHFRDMAAEYGLADTGHSTQAAFFDYDNDGDLDVYIVTNVVDVHAYPDDFHPVMKNGANPSTGRLYRNDWNTQLQHPVFIDVSKQAGIQTEGYGHSVNITDINNDGWKDIYVTNDFVTNDLLWINNHDGTFTESLSKYFKHTSANAMGNDIADINNDGLPDVIALDMNPEDNYRKKMMMNPASYQKYQNSDRYGYNYQYVRNTLQLNQGPAINENDSIGTPVFSEISYLAGMAETDWSWTPLVADFDNDGYRDLIITNGFPKDITDHDFIAYRSQAYLIASKEQVLKQVPAVKLHNYAFRNSGKLSFANETDNWGLAQPSFSNGAAYADLDNDGYLDMIVNNINDEAFIYRNESKQLHTQQHYLQLQFRGANENRNGIGAIVILHYDHGKTQVAENTPYRGYLSSVQSGAHFGLNNVAVIDSINIQWPDGKVQLLQQVKTDQTLTVNIANAVSTTAQAKPAIAVNNLFTDVTNKMNLHYQARERDFIDFNIQKLLPHKFSEYGPSLSVADVNGDGLPDMVTGGSNFYSAQLFLQQPGNTFLQKSLLNGKDTTLKHSEDLGTLLFDADGDGDADLYIASGGYESAPGSSNYQDHFYLNDGKGNFTEDSAAIPKNHTSKFCVRAVDYDKDGDLDLFISGRVDPWNYPKPVSSFILRNDTRDGHVHFTDVTASVAKDLINIGLVCDALFTDFDNDGWPDLILAGEWMPVTFLKNDHGIFRNATASTGIAANTGWWNTIAPGDFDNDGDMDYVVGNLGLNSFYKASEKYPVFVTAKDFDNNGSYDAFPSLYLPASQEDRQLKEFPGQTRDDVVKQMISMRSRFQNYKSFATATMDEVLPAEQRKGALRLKATTLESALLRNDGHGHFTIEPLPLAAQVSVLCGMVTDDFDGDGNLDIAISGNDYGTDVTVGRYDALNGLLLKGDGKGHFSPLSILQSGIFIPGNGKALAKLNNKQNEYLLAAMQNRGPMKVFKLKYALNLRGVNPDDAAAVLTFKDGRKQRQEFYYGVSYLSQSARLLSYGSGTVTATITNSKGVSRTIPLQ